MKVADFQQFIKGLVDVEAMMSNDKSYSVQAREVSHQKYGLLQCILAVAMQLDAPEEVKKLEIK